MCFRSRHSALLYNGDTSHGSSLLRPQSCPQESTLYFAHARRICSAPSTGIHNCEVSSENVENVENVKNATTDATLRFDSSVAAIVHSIGHSLCKNCIKSNNNSNCYCLVVAQPTSEETVRSINFKHQITGKLSSGSHKKGLLEARGAVKLTLNLLPKIENFDPSPRFAEQNVEDLVFLSTASHRLTSNDLAHATNNLDALFCEFWKIPMHYASISELPQSQSVRCKNRYHTIIPNCATRVILPPLKSKFSDGTYINANYVRGYAGSQPAFIATQGPMEETIGDLWRMVWLTQPRALVMITALIEKKRRKCALYFPLQVGQSLVVCQQSGLSVTTLDVEQHDGWTVRRISLCQTSMDGNMSHHFLNHYWYYSWPDHATPNVVRQLVALVETVIPMIGIEGPVVVHCSAGVGRTGAFCALCIAIQQLRHEQMCDPLRTVCQLRLDRGGMVQTHEQYEFLHRALLLYVQDNFPLVESRTSS